MNLIRSLLGRRQFLIASMASASALTFSKLAGALAPASQRGVAMASDLSGGVAQAAENPVPAGSKANTSGRYPHLLSPLKIRSKILKNRMMYTRATPHFLQGPETYPAEVLRSYFANLAKSAALVTCRFDGDHGRPRSTRTGDTAHIPIFDLEDPGVQNYIDQMVEAVHCMGSLVTGISLEGGATEDLVTMAKKLEDKGIDVVSMSVRDFRDKNAVRSIMEQMQAVRRATGLLIMISTYVIEPSVRPEMSSDPGAVIDYTVFLKEEAVQLAKAFEDSADILFFKPAGGMTSHPTCFNQEKGHPVVLRIAQAIKESGAKIIVAPNGGFRDPDENEAYIASGKTDMIAMARALICDEDYGEKVYEGRGEDTVPCIMCNKCHGISMTEPWYDVCSVNPKFGTSTAVGVIKAPIKSKTVAVIGGGPAGMKAAITAAERGHRVILYEKNDTLGGLIRHADYSPFKWALKDYKDYLVRQTHKAGVEVLLKTEATPEMIQSKGYDVVLAALGADPAMPHIPGAEGGNVWNVSDVYPNEKKLGKRVAFIGGGEFGVETAMYLAKAGHRVMVLTSEKELVRDERVHYPEQLIDAYEHLENFDFITEAIATGISKGKVTYTNGKGGKKEIEADSVVIYSGLKPRQDEALTFSGAAGKAFFAVGDCSGMGGNVQRSIRNAFFTAVQI